MNEYTITNNIIHGKSFAFPIGNADFTTWRLNDDTGEYWMKFHFPSGKEIRLKVTEEELKTFCRQHLAGFKMPKTFVFQTLPKTSTGKIQKFELREVVKKL